MAHDVFISHSSHDREVANAACGRLEADGCRCWIAPRDILPGQDYGAAILEGIRGARLFLLVFSSQSNDSPQVKREVERAATSNIPIIPFRVEDVTPSLALEYFISGAHWLDAIDPPLDRHLDYLSAVVGRIVQGDEGAPAARPELRSVPPPPRPVGRQRLLWGAGAAALIVVAALGGWAVFGGPGGAEAEKAKAGTTIFTRRAVPLPAARQLRLRAAPSQDAPVVTLIPPDEVFRVAPRNGDWWPARLRSGDEGFVSHRWIRVIDEEVPTAAGPPARRPPAVGRTR